jgi:hypothetical protein
MMSIVRKKGRCHKRFLKNNIHIINMLKKRRHRFNLKKAVSGFTAGNGATFQKLELIVQFIRKIHVSKNSIKL